MIKPIICKVKKEKGKCGAFSAPLLPSAKAKSVGFYFLFYLTLKAMISSVELKINLINKR